MKTIYIAHRLFALHDRSLAAGLASYLKEKEHNLPLFLPYCDTQEQTLVVPKKGFYLFERDIERLKHLSALVAIVHGPSYDDGVCMEIGFAYGGQAPVLLFTTDFLTYSFGSDPTRFVFADPLLNVLDTQVVHVSDPALQTSEPDLQASNHYDTFRQRHDQSLLEAFERIWQWTQERVNKEECVGIWPEKTENLVYIEPSPYHSAQELEQIKATIVEQGWTSYEARRLHVTTHIEEAARMDLRKALESQILILDGNGPDVPIGAAFLTGLGLALSKTVLLYYTGTQITHAHGREPNERNLMLLYGCTSLIQNSDQLKHLLKDVCHQKTPEVKNPQTS